MSNTFFDIFNGLNVNERAKDIFCDVTFDRVVKSKDKKCFKIYLSTQKTIPVDVLYSVEKQIELQMFPAEDIEVKLLGFSTEIGGGEDKACESDTNGFNGNTLKGEDTTATNLDTILPEKKEEKSSKKKNKDSKSSKGSKPENLLYGRPIKEQNLTAILDLTMDMRDVVIVGEVFKSELKPTRTGKTFLVMYITDKTSSVSVKVFSLEPEEGEALHDEIKAHSYIKIRGSVGYDKFDNDITLMSVKGIEKAESNGNIRMDYSAKKRVELHLHTKMSEMDGIIAVDGLVKRLKAWGHSSCAITDHGVAHSFPKAAMAAGDDIKLIYGIEGYVCDNTKPIAHVKAGYEEYSLSDEVVVFDLETTGLNASKEEIIEIGAAKVKNGEITERFSTFVNPNRPLPYEIIELTNIDDSMVINAPQISEVLPKFREFCGNLPLVAHNADFDISCIKATCKRLFIDWDMTYLDTVPIARLLLKNLFKVKLDNVAKALNVKLFNHHRAVDDAECTALIYNKLLENLSDMDIHSFGDLYKLDTNDPMYIKKLFPSHATILAKNDMGRSNLYRLISKSHISYHRNYPRIPKSLLSEYREGLIIGSGCRNGELFDALLSGKNDAELERIVKFYDFLEVQPCENNMNLISSGKYGIKDVNDIRGLNAKIVELGEKYDIPVVATSDAHFIDPEEELYRTIILTERKINPVKNPEKELYLRTTEEMLNSFDYLGEDKAYSIVVENSNLISNMCEPIKPTRPDKSPPEIENSDKMLREICYRKAHELYGENLPTLLEERLEKELNSIISNGYAFLYIVSQKLVWKSNEDGYMVGSRGSVGSSLVAMMAGISEVNPLPLHYYCKSCHYVDFDSDTIKENAGQSGFDLPEKLCPNCNKPLEKNGFDIPFETFLGFKGDKEPDIDLNFSGEYQDKAHKYTEIIFGDDRVFRAGTVGSVQDKTSLGYTRKYFEHKDMVLRSCELERLSAGAVGVKRSTGQHPGGIIVLPDNEEIETFTPIQYPANDSSSEMFTTHFDYHAIESNLLKLDILSKDDPTQLRLLEQLSGVKAESISFDDKSVVSLFQSTEALGLTPDDLLGCDFGTLGIPEFNTNFAMGILRDTKPQTIMDLVRIAGLSHGTDVYNGNSKELILDGIATLQTAICTRDDIMLYLMGMGLPSDMSFKIMESVRKGKIAKGNEPNWPEWKEEMKKHNIPEWYISSCEKIKYMFPKAHAAAYVMMGYRLGYYKIYYPQAFYAAYFSVKATAFDYRKMCQGKEVLLHYMTELTQKDKDDLSDKDAALLRDMRVVLEMYARGYSFLPIDIYKSKALEFDVSNGKIRPPFNAIDEMGPVASVALFNAAKASRFTSKDDIRDRGKVPKKAIEAMEEFGLLEGFSQSDQLSLFDFMKTGSD